MLEKVREKYIEVGQVGGQVRLEHSTAGERRELASFLGKPAYRDATIKLRLVDLDTALRQSGFACTLPELLFAFFPDQPLMTRQEQRAIQALQQADLRTTLLSIATPLPATSRGRWWLLYGVHGLEWLFSRYKNAMQEEQEQQLRLVRYVASVLDQLPASHRPERLALFAQRTSGDPHMLDADRPAGRLLLLALNDLASNSEMKPSSMLEVPLVGTPQASTLYAGTLHANTLRLYSDVGLLVDTISSSVAVFNLTSATYTNGTPDPLLSAAGARVLLLPLRQVLEWQSAQPAQADIYLFENPQVFEEVIAGCSGSDTPLSLPTLICTAGWPSVAALTLLDLLVAGAPNVTLRYSGDFDLKGLQIATYLLAHYPGRCRSWRFDSDAYAYALQNGGVPARENDLELLKTLPDIFASLVAKMQEQGKWAYQEGIVHLLLADVRMKRRN